MKINLDDSGKWLRFAPLTLTRPVGDVRMGILSNTERWTLLVPGAEIGFLTEAYLQEKFPAHDQADITINASVIPDLVMAEEVLALGKNGCLMHGEVQIAAKGNGTDRVNSAAKLLMISHRWDLYQNNAAALEADFELITEGRTSRALSATNTIVGNPARIFLEEGATVEAAILNTTAGPIYIGKDAEIMEGSMVRGPLAMCEHSALKLGSKVYGPTTLGPHCKAGGELNNVIFQAYSNKGHDGFLGNALIGEWCNLGADTNTSNLKNNYGAVSTYSYEERTEVKTDVLFMGVCMGDHSKCGINTMFNTATVVGVSANVYGAGFPQKFVPSFTWGGEQFVPFRFDKAIEYANNMMARRGKELTDAEIRILKHVADNE